MTTLNYYKVLQVPPTASALEIKKAYRKLALQYHPDRNSDSTAKEQFQQVGEAYQCLSDPAQRAAYDQELRERVYTNNASTTVPIPTHRQYQGTDAFTQFNHLFGTDPFFQEAFAGMDEEFAKQFQESQPPTRSATTAKEGWIPWLLRQCGIQFTMTSYTTDAHGNMTASHVSNTGAGAPSTSKQSQTHVDPQGRRVVVRSMQQGPNKVEEKYIDNLLVERSVNGVVQALSNTEQHHLEH